MGLNIGSEIFGKGDGFTRPILVINADNPEHFVGIPLSSKLKTRANSCVVKTSDGTLNQALVYQIKHYDDKRLVNKISTLDKSEYVKLQPVYHKLLKI